MSLFYVCLEAEAVLQHQAVATEGALVVGHQSCGQDEVLVEVRAVDVEGSAEADVVAAVEAVEMASLQLE